MWCKSCNIETNEEKCPVCGNDTVSDEDITTKIYWCRRCNIPVIQRVNQADRGICPLCSGKMRYLAMDLRPVFPEERLLLEILLDKSPNEFAESSVWAVNNRYYIDGKSISLSNELFQNVDTNAVLEKINQYKGMNQGEVFDKYIEKCILANRNRTNHIKDEAYTFVKRAAKEFEEEKIVISFSGGKDSTVTADVVDMGLDIIGRIGG